MPESVLVVEDDRELRDLLVEVLRSRGYHAVPFSNARSALRAIAAGQGADVVVTDLKMPGMRGEDLLRELRERSSEVNVIVITAFGSIDSAIALIKAGAYDYLTKPLNTGDLVAAVERALAESRVRRETMQRIQAGGGGPAGFVGRSAPMQRLYELIARAAHSRHPVIITGESGTGKELVARALHQTRGNAPFIAVNCGALPETLLESELFGHEKGAFTGADQPKAGLFEAADTGTLFLDEIADLPVVLQPKLLRAIEREEIRRVGATTARQLDVRIVAATNRNLEEEVRAGRFREDLFWRLNVLHLHLPPLRERSEDVPLLVAHFLSQAIAERERQDNLNGSPHLGAARRLAPDTISLLLRYPWPGNVRELRNAIQRATTLARTDEIQPDDLPLRIREPARSAASPTGTPRRVPLREFERRYLLEVLQEVGGNKTRAAEILGLDRKTLSRKLEEYQQDPTSEAP
ncbi:MAG: sigma-54-dependent Fis family transcriptional regulator [Gemmatimonadetes bacterium]|nr:sigma-54-dependent Fis family transcriptional regulator [Gemmatimonadota bacterium]